MCVCFRVCISANVPLTCRSLFFPPQGEKTVKMTKTTTRWICPSAPSRPKVGLRLRSPAASRFALWLRSEDKKRCQNIVVQRRGQSARTNYLLPKRPSGGISVMSETAVGRLGSNQKRKYMLKKSEKNPKKHQKSTSRQKAWYLQRCR